MKQDNKPTGKSKKKQKEAVHHRSKYVDQSLRFLDWVNQLGIEKTWFGKMIQTLDDQFQLRRFALLFLFSLFLSYVLFFQLDFSFRNYEVGDVATADVRAPISFEMIDEHATRANKVLAEDSVPPVFDYVRELYDQRVVSIYDAFRKMRRKLPKSWSRKESRREIQIKDHMKLKPEFEALVPDVKIKSQTFEWLVANRFSVKIENAIIRALDFASSKKIVTDLNPLRQSGQDQIVIRVVEKQGGGEEFTQKVSELTDLYTVKKLIPIPEKKFNGRDETRLRRLIGRLIIPNISLNHQETASRREAARASVDNLVLNIRKGQIILNEGSIVDGAHLRIFEEIRERQTSHNKDMKALFTAALFVCLILVFLSFIRRFTLNRLRVETKDFVVMGVVAFLMVIISKIMLFLGLEAVHKNYADFVPESTFLYLLPAAAGPMLIGLLITSGEIVWLYSTFIGAVLSVMVGFDFSFLIYAICGGIAGARGVHGCKKRHDIYFAGLRVGGVNMLVVALLTVSVQFGTEQFSQSILMWNMVAGFFSGVVSCMVAMFLVPFFESAFNYTTDVKLLELSSMDHPLMREMSLKAGGTHSHSQTMASMVERACMSIGANPLLGRVSSYYHDIGKIEHCQYFIENQKQGKNPHDHLSPHMSKTILVAHVKDGVELGMKYKLGKPIIDVILQHHGTTLISFFYNRAKEEEDVDIDEIEEDEFRYPGPKPQFKEAALCMLADSIEAAARSLDEPNPMRLRNIVKNIIHRKFMDGQLDQCDLTLKDLSLIEQSFYQVLLSIHHQRIDYPKKAGGGASESPDNEKPPLRSV